MVGGVCCLKVAKSDENVERLKEWLDFQPDVDKQEGDMDDLGTLSDYEFGG